MVQAESDAAVIGKVLYNNIVLNGLHEYVRLSLVLFFSVFS